MTTTSATVRWAAAATMLAATVTVPVGAAGISIGGELPDRHVPLAVQGSAMPVHGFEHDGRILRIYGDGFSTGMTAVDSAWRFVQQNADMLGVRTADLAARAEHLPQGHTTPAMYDAATGTHKFTVVYFAHERDAVPVYGSRLTLLVRNEADFPLVLVNPDVRSLGNFQVDAALAAAPIAPLVQQRVALRFGGDSAVMRDRKVIWAGTGDDPVAPRLADDCVVAVGDVDKWRLICDAMTGEILHEEQLICFVDMVGNVSGLATEGEGADLCEDEVPMGLPFVRVLGEAPGAVTYTDENGDYVLPNAGAGLIRVAASLVGQYFEVQDFFSPTLGASLTGSAPGPVDLLLNDLNIDEEARAQVNGYLQANVVRSFTASYSPSYPTISQGEFPVWTNRTDGFCPGNAWYDPVDDSSPVGVSINFCRSSSERANTAFSSVVHHEFGHHLVRAGGSGQGQYGEGMGDVMSVLILDSPLLGVGFRNTCDDALRTADNTQTYPCFDEIHYCGQLIAGCVWDTRLALASTNPADAIDVLAPLMIDSILVHSGSAIDPSITVDVLTLDDDDGNILNGTPHWAAIEAGFGLHDMPGPELGPIGIVFPDGRPTISAPEGETFRVEVRPLSGTPVPDSGLFSHRIDDGPTTTVPMVELSANLYEATFPSAPCGSNISWWVTADAVGEGSLVEPVGAPATTFITAVADAVVVDYADDFEFDEGWAGVVVDAESGEWQRGAPVNDPDWAYDPEQDGDGSGQAWLTQNEFGNTDVDEGSVELYSPIRPIAIARPSVRYKYFLRLSDDDDGTDVLRLDVSTNGPSGPWTELAVHDTDGGLNWRSHEITPAQLEALGLTFGPATRFRFTATDGNPQSVVEAGVDGFELVGLECVETNDCPADLDGSGSVGFNDLTAVLNAWGDCPEPPATCAPDIDGLGVVGFNDLTIVLNAWGDCP